MLSYICSLLEALPMRLFALLALVTCGAHLGALVDESVLPRMEALERGEGLGREQVGAVQWTEMQQGIERASQKLRVMTYNMLMDDYDIYERPENRWPERLPRIVELIRYQYPDLICTQELSPTQLQQLVEKVNDTYEVAGTGEQSEGYILVRKGRISVDSLQNLQIDAEPAPEPRLTLALLTDKESGQQFYVASSHFTFSKPAKRAEEALWVAEHIAPLAKEHPVIFCGDLNTFPMRYDLERLPAYDGDWVQRTLAQAGLRDATSISILGNLGPLSTFTNVPNEFPPIPFRGTGTPGVILDHIYVAGAVEVLLHAVEPARVDGHFPSDHMPLIADLLFPKQKSE
jgi:endonuclease/exonuclease/phosphatase family metal-dependent hydrolase